MAPGLTATAPTVQPSENEVVAKSLKPYTTLSKPQISRLFPLIPQSLPLLLFVVVSLPLLLLPTMYRAAASLASKAR